MPPAQPDTSVRAWKPSIRGVREVLHATFREHAYPPHTHDTWTLFLVDAGAIHYDLDGRTRAAAPATVAALPPHVMHDGRPATRDGYRKRVLYIETSVLDESLSSAAVDAPVLRDPVLPRRVAALHDALASADDALEAETRFAGIADAVRAALGFRDDRPHAPSPEVAAALRDHLDAHVFEQLTLADAAAAIGSSVTVLARSFAGAFGIAPHRYVIGRRLDAARERILAGQPLADVAADVGFADQAHLTRNFRRFLGTTPGAFAAAVPGSRGRRATRHRA